MARTGHEGGAAGEDRVLTLPNAVTAIRLLLIPVYVLLLAQPHRAHWEAAGWLLGGIGATDFLDGQLARRLHQVSTLGKVLDPVADRVLLATAAISTIAVGVVPVWIAVLALVREGLVAAGFLYVASRGGRRMDVSWPGKAGAFALMTALPGFLLGHAAWAGNHVFEDLAWVFAIVGLVVGIYAAAGYVGPARRELARVRQEADADEPDADAAASR